MVSIPRFRDDMCDSWHLAQYVKNFQTDKTLMDALAGYARKERSRFVLMTPEGIDWFGEGWLCRDGVYYSNSSALGHSRVFNNACNSTGRRHFEGGMLDDDDIEITCPDRFPGFGYDTDRKIWTNKLKPVVEHYGRQLETSKNISGAKNTWFFGCVYDHVQQMYVKPEDRKPDPMLGGIGTNHTGLTDKKTGTPPVKIIELFSSKDITPQTTRMQLQGMIVATIKAIEQAPWMTNLEWGCKGTIRSWPKDRDFTDVRFKYGYNTTYRVLTTRHKKWREIKYDPSTGAYQGNVFPVEGPFPEGLVIEWGNPQVTIGQTKLPLHAWKGLVIEAYMQTVLAPDPEADERGAPFDEPSSQEMTVLEGELQEAGLTVFQEPKDGETAAGLGVLSDEDIMAALEGKEAPLGKDAPFLEAYNELRRTAASSSHLVLKVNPDTGKEYVEVVANRDYLA